MMKKSAIALLVAMSLTILNGCGNGDTTMSEETTKAVIEADPNRKVIALTFDDGPNILTTRQVLDKLEEHGVVASFFVVGNNITDSTKPVIERAYEMGCEINNHSRTHSDMTKLTEEEIKAEIQYTSDKVEEIIGIPTPFFRPPYIAVNQTMFDSIDLPFICGYGSNDWDDAVGVEERSQKVLDQISDGSIILLHDMMGNSKTVEALDLLIPALKEQGYEFVTVTELFNVKGVEISGNTDIVYSYPEQK